MKISANEVTVIKRANAEHVDRIIEIADTLGLSRRTKSDYLTEVSGPSTILLIAVTGDLIAGFISGRLLPTGVDGSNMFDAEIHNIGVVSEFRNKGLGSSLLKAFLNEASSGRGISGVWLEVRDSNLEAKSFYEKRGFKVAYRRKNYYAEPLEDAFLMVLRQDRQHG